LQKQSADEKARLRQFIIGNFAQDLLPVLDSFEMAMKNKQVWEQVDENWRKGIEYILQQFHTTLEQYGIKPLQTKIGDEFDPNMHESMEQIETDEDSKDGTIAEIIQEGYKNGETILRPTKVKVFSNQK
jgi:molecular chaperone GrpE